MAPARVALLVVACALVLAACGGGGKKSAPTTSTTSTSPTTSTTPTTPAGPKKVLFLENSYGSGADKVWVFVPAHRKPRVLVIFLHGLGNEAETTPIYHLPWIAHLAKTGDAVFYPAYEAQPGGPDALLHVIRALTIATPVLGKLRPPVVVIGYSRGGGLAVDYTAVARAVGPVPKAVLAVFPAMSDTKLDLRSVAPGTRFVFLVGDRDTVVGALGARVLFGMLLKAKYPTSLVKTEIVQSHDGWSANHLAPLGTSAAAKDAFWAPADRLIASVLKG